MSPTFGQPGRCLWCGSKKDGELRELTFDARKDGEPERVLACSEDCESALRRTQDDFEGKVPYFLGGFVLASVLALVGSFGQALDSRLLHLLGLGTVLAGVVLVRLPFVTPQTVEILGMRNGLRLGRAIGWMFIVGGLVLAAWIVTYLRQSS